MVNLRSVDPNLLVILDLLLDEAHVGRAAERLGLSQPAASNALARARSMFNDPLLVRSASGGLRRTPRADNMREPLRAALAELAAIVAAEPLDRADIRGAVRLVAPDVPAAALGAALTSELAKRAPGIDLIFHPWHAGDEVERLERGEVDLVVAVARFFGASLRNDPLGAILTRHSCDMIIRRQKMKLWTSIVGWRFRMSLFPAKAIRVGLLTRR